VNTIHMCMQKASSRIFSNSLEDFVEAYFGAYFMLFCVHKVEDMQNVNWRALLILAESIIAFYLVYAECRGLFNFI